MCGVYLNRSRIVVFLLFLPMFLILLSAENLFILLG
jgi:hypothetical protein